MKKKQYCTILCKIQSDLFCDHFPSATTSLQRPPLTKNQYLLLSVKFCYNNSLVSDHLPSATTLSVHQVWHKCLGVEIDEKLNFEKHINKVCKKVSAGIGAIRRIRPFVPIDSQKTYIELSSVLWHCSPIWDTCLQDKLQRLQSRAARVITITIHSEIVTRL